MGTGSGGWPAIQGAHAEDRGARALHGPSKETLYFDGDLSAYALADLLQLVCTSHDTARVEIADDTGVVGRLEVFQGMIVDCEAEALRAEAAFFHLFSLRAGRFRVFRGGAGPSATPFPMRAPWRGLLFEAAHREDELARSHERTPEEAVDRSSSDFVELRLSTVPPPPPVPEVGRVLPFRRAERDEADPPAATVPEVPLAQRLAEATQTYLRRDYDGALRLFEACLASAPEDPRILLMIQRIRERNRQG